MKKNLMSVMVLFATSVSVIIMLHSSGYIAFDFSFVSAFRNSVIDKVAAVSNNLPNYNEIVVNFNKKTDSNAKSTNSEAKAVNKEGSSDQDDALQPVGSVRKYTNVVQFRVPAEKLKEAVTEADKSKLMDMTNKISPIDSLKIERYLKENDTDTAIINIVALLNTRLSKKDYEKLREIADKYIDIKRVENAIGI